MANFYLKVWIEHNKCGMWLDGPFDSLHITGVIIRNTLAGTQNNITQFLQQINCFKRRNQFPQRGNQ